MKKFLTAMSIVLGLGLANAQKAVPATKSTVQKTTKTVKYVKPQAAKSAVKLKKDGTPDRRFKENQNLKKDGTPDRRYKANK
ncbi:hypothetical protein [Chryseobacterium chendengshani]|uniref:hypothetical protein n=1 Tax=unclassified Chryseobacterium TaxID=2593645 RepID=UPI001C63FC00|nr:MULTISPECIES: hypothetical protein [unclassified Chryseobacterium]MBW7675582.1 hypothetical protein [Chryseobacterium sp. LJ756]MBW8521855.1 hypothetical protein [Chryseobacterium sp. LJ668]QYK17514.1 hypothetical protein K0U91_05160 [Chryseobacterium sp. LJ668]